MTAGCCGALPNPRARWGRRRCRSGIVDQTVVVRAVDHHARQRHRTPMTQRDRRRAERVARRTSAQSRAGVAVSCSACLPLATSAHLSASSAPVWTAARASPRRSLLAGFASCDQLGRDRAAVPALPTEQRSGHEPTVTRLGVKQPRSAWRATTSPRPRFGAGTRISASEGRVQRLL